MPSVGGLSQSCLFRKHPHWRWTAASVGDRIKCPDSAIRCGCRASCRIHAIFFIVFSCSELGTEKKRKATTLHSGRASGISARPGTAGRNFWGAPTAKIDGHQSGCSKKKIASIFIHFGLFFFGPKVSEWIDAVAAIHWANRSSALPLNQGPPLPPANSSDAVAAEM